ncbi:hypothetical protein ACQ3I4_07000 [Zafaria sp. Z1313]|uniref:hypothetical protein n=1 Tax=unclassified Zafaria TaxID=2828765 RepID=UPI002E791BE3|nr:hypothetical protein [Zafaria sp. J156]MEE1620429.1 hypothetical protein [Zafaria sp. J156]
MVEMLQFVERDVERRFTGGLVLHRRRIRSVFHNGRPSPRRGSGIGDAGCMGRALALWNGHRLLTESPRKLARAYAEERLVRVRPGYYFPADEWSGLTAWDRYGLSLAAHAAARPDTVFCGPTALFLWKVSMMTTPTALHVMTSRPTGGRTTPGLVSKARLSPQARLALGGAAEVKRHFRKHAVEDVDGFAVAALVPTVVEQAATQELPGAVVVLDSFRRRYDELRAGDRGLPEAFGVLVDAADSLGSPTARDRFRDRLALSSGLAESAGESLSRVGIRELGFETPVEQHEFTLSDGSKARTDFYWPRARLIGEFDGQVKYSEPSMMSGRSEAEVRREEKRREELLKRSGLHVFRWTWTEAMNPATFENILSGNGVPRRSRGSAVDVPGRATASGPSARSA